MNHPQHMTFLFRRRNHMAVHTDGNYVLNFQEKVQQLERQLQEMEKEKERELNSLRKEKRELIHTTQTVRWIEDRTTINTNVF